MAFRGPRPPSAAVDDASIGNFAWSNPTRILFNNDSQTASLIPLGILGSGTDIGHYIVTTGYKFDVQATATITGISVMMSASASGNPGEVVDNSLRLVKAGVISGNDLSAGSDWSPTGTFVAKVWGGPSELWGLALAPSDVNDANFGWAYSPRNLSAGSTRSFLADYATMTAYFTLPGGDQIFAQTSPLGTAGR